MKGLSDNLVELFVIKGSMPDFSFSIGTRIDDILKDYKLSQKQNPGALAELRIFLMDTGPGSTLA